MDGRGACEVRDGEKFLNVTFESENILVTIPFKRLAPTEEKRFEDPVLTRRILDASKEFSFLRRVDESLQVIFCHENRCGGFIQNGCTWDRTRVASSLLECAEA